MMKNCLLVGLLALTGSGVVNAETLLGYDGASTNLYTVDTDVPSAALVGSDADAGIPAEIELAGNTLYVADTGTNTNLHVMDPATGMVSSTLTLNFPPEGNVLTSLEDVDGTLYAGLTTEGGGETYLSTVDLGTGDVTVIGATGIGSPSGGLAYNTNTGVMYAVSAGGSAGELFTVNLTTGAATSVGQIMVDGGTVGMTGLEFGPSGTLYGLPNVNQAIAGHLLMIDPATGDATDLGDLGVSDMNALTAEPVAAAGEPALPVPTLSVWGLALLAFGAILLAMAGRRKAGMS